MAEFSGVKLTQNADNQSQKAEQLESIVKSIVSKMEEIDTEIKSLVQGGMEGSAVAAMAGTYIQNREVINDYVKRFAATACVLHENAQTMKTINQNSDTAASGVASTY